MTRTTRTRRTGRLPAARPSGPALVLAALLTAALALLAVLAVGQPTSGPTEFGEPRGAPGVPPTATAAPDRLTAQPPQPPQPPLGVGTPAEAGPRHPPRTASGRSETDGDPPPERLRVARIGLDARVVPTGVDEDGAAEVPDDPARAGWYRFGPAPGADRGSAVLLGHVDSRTGELGALAALYDVRAGDEVTVERRHGRPVRFQVTARRVVPKDNLPERTFARAGPHVLTLVTCAPPYDARRGGYQNNVLVTAQPLDRN
ncbi:class F sortase [Streptomyces alkaliterrae]|uniref:Sortase n=1 Tax=Streptomyces alkaliterrae TaxID=2213162 RepID=A0A5P0YZR9_9ACTN|nr:class F sortase [Streptomyces alkaliterrae]MBB1260873.1 class F sortase [Streptomyces alkaliterrae]MQS05312.1 sortase [Streptomyces alkaliterrae]